MSSKLLVLLFEVRRNGNNGMDEYRHAEHAVQFFFFFFFFFWENQIGSLFVIFFYYTKRYVPVYVFCSYAIGFFFLLYIVFVKQHF